MRIKNVFFNKFYKQQDYEEKESVLSAALSVPFSGSGSKSLYFTENPDFIVSPDHAHSCRFPGSRIFLYSSDPEQDIKTVSAALFDILHRYFALHSPDDVICWKDDVLYFPASSNSQLAQYSSSASAVSSDPHISGGKVIVFPSQSKKQCLSIK